MTTTTAEPLVYEANGNFYAYPAAFVHAYRAWLAAHGIDPDSTYRTEHHFGEMPFVRVFQFDRDAEGRLYRDEATGLAAKRPPLDVPVKTPIPTPGETR